MRWPFFLLPLTFACSSFSGTAEVEAEIPLGVEVVTGIRSDYVYRGFHLAGTTLDAQIESEVALTDSLFIRLGAWLASQTSDDFSETGAYLDTSYFLSDTVKIGGSFSYRGRDESLLSDANELDIYLQLFPSNDWNLKILGSRDLEIDGWYAALEGGWSHRINDDTYLGLTSGISWVDDYYTRNGFNDLYGRLSLTYNINRTVSVTPFAGWSVLLDSNDTGSDRIFAGFWFEVVF